ncbi:MAG: hypothetical protein NTX36_11000, partial [Proteobacteria bacterium]|nr:hypothetical protein [Pseudomonadota bacterium]
YIFNIIKKIDKAYNIYTVGISVELRAESEEDKLRPVFSRPLRSTMADKCWTRCFISAADLSPDIPYALSGRVKTIRLISALECLKLTRSPTGMPVAFCIAIYKHYP